MSIPVGEAGLQAGAASSSDVVSNLPVAIDDPVDLADDDDFDELGTLLLTPADRETKSKLWHEVLLKKREKEGRKTKKEKKRERGGVGQGRARVT